MPRPRANKLLRYLRNTVLALVLLIVVLAALFVSLEPTVEARQRPTARDVAAAREVWAQLRTAQEAQARTRVRADDRAVESIASLASDASGLGRFAGGISGGVLSGEASLALPAGLWINVSARASGEHAGFPAYRLKIGRVSFPLWVGRWAANLARHALRLKGATVPPLDEMVRHVQIDRQEVVADVALPKGSGVIDGLIATRVGPLDEPLVSDIYCRIAMEQRKAPVANLSELLARTFEPARVENPEDYNRAAFVALSLLVVGDKAEALAPLAAELARNCPHPPGGFLLQQREDLAKHWTFSAGLTAALGGETAASLGEWKELDDSLANGSGFSFVDLAADRSGTQTALRALDAGTAAAAAAELARATDEDLMPAALLQAPAGLSEASFIDRFGALDRERYRLAVASIDEILARSRASPPVAD